MCPQSLVSSILTVPANLHEAMQQLYPQVGGSGNPSQQKGILPPQGENAVILEASSVVSGAGSRTSFSTWLKAGEGLAVVILHVVRWVGKGNMYSCTLKFDPNGLQNSLND